MSALAEGSDTGIRRIGLQLRTQQLKIGDLSSNCVLVGRFEVEEGGKLTAELTLGELAKATAQADWGPEQESLTMPDLLRVEVERLSLEVLSTMLGGRPNSLQGTANGKLKIGLGEFIPETNATVAGSNSDWFCNGVLNVASLELSYNDRVALSLGDLQLDVAKPLGESSASVTLQNSENSLDGNLRLNLNPRGFELLATAPAEFLEGYEGAVNAADFRFGLVSQRSSRVALGKLLGELTFRGSPTEWLTRADMVVDRLSLGLEQPIDLLDCRGQVSTEEFRLSRFRLQDRNGRIAGSASFSRISDGEHQIKLGIPNLNLDRDLADWGITNPLGGQVAAKVQLQKPAENSDWFDGWNGSIQGVARELSIRSRPLGSVEFRGRLANGEVQAAGTGLLLGGATDLKFSRRLVHASGQPSQVASNIKRQFAHSVQLDLRKLKLDALANIATSRPLAARLGGTSSGQIQFDINPNADLSVNAVFGLERLSIDEHVLIDSADLAADYKAGQLFLRRLNGRLLGGTLTAFGDWRIGNPANRESAKPLSGKLRYQLQRCDARDLLAVVVPESEIYDGFLSSTGEVRFGGD